jgi:phage regulator Rha-like protein
MTKKNTALSLSNEVVISKIHHVRGRKVMLDRDLAELYGVQPIRLREQVKRNIDRFPDKFMFQLTEKEVANMVSQFAIPSKKHLGGYLPYAFTEHGILMLANVLRSKTAIQVSIRIIDIFVKMREMLSASADILLKLEQLERKFDGHDEDIKLIFVHLKRLIDPPQKPRRRVGFRRKDEQE